jgi:hypothetical protein
MLNWKTASPSDLKRLKAITRLLRKYPVRVVQIFHPTQPHLIASPQALARGCQQPERTMIGLAYDFWISGMVGIKVADLEHLDNENFESVIAALTLLRNP